MGTGASSVALLWLFSALRAGRSAPLESRQGDTVLSLSAHNFATTLQTNHAVLVAFCAPFCSHCNNLKPELEKAKGALNGRVLLATVDAHSEVDLAQIFDIGAYPTVYFWRGGQQYQYGGGRHNSSIVKWLLEHSGLSVLVTNEEGLATALRTRRTATIFVARGQQHLQNIFREVAIEHNEMGTFYFVETSGDPVVQVYRGVNEVVDLRGEETKISAAVLGFLQTEQLPQWGEITQRNYATYMKSGFEYLLWACFDPSTVQADAKHLSEMFVRIADQAKTALFVYLDTAAQGEFARDDLGCTDYPTLSFQFLNSTPGKDKRHTLPFSVSDITEQAISLWMQRVINGETNEQALLQGVGRECLVRVHNVGQTLTSETCAELVSGRAGQGCGVTFMFSAASTQSGCWCCAPGDVGKANRLWSLYKISGPTPERM